MREILEEAGILVSNLKHIETFTIEDFRINLFYKKLDTPISVMASPEHRGHVFLSKKDLEVFMSASTAVGSQLRIGEGEIRTPLSFDNYTSASQRVIMQHLLNPESAINKAVVNRSLA